MTACETKNHTKASLLLERAETRRGIVETRFVELFKAHTDFLTRRGSKIVFTGERPYHSLDMLLTVPGEKRGQRLPHGDIFLNILLTENPSAVLKVRETKERQTTPLEMAVASEMLDLYNERKFLEAVIDLLRNELPLMLKTLQLNALLALEAAKKDADGICRTARDAAARIDGGVSEGYEATIKGVFDGLGEISEEIKTLCEKSAQQIIDEANNLLTTHYPKIKITGLDEFRNLLERFSKAGGLKQIMPLLEKWLFS